MNLCPKTCESHFFGTKVQCFSHKAAQAGCECDEGYVRDKNRCVRPEECNCLDKLCVDRVDSQQCATWRDKGRCEKFAKEMGKVCRRTCGLCQMQCRDIMNTEKCRLAKLQNRCSEHFIKQMCQGTCNPRACECGECKEVKSECNLLTHNREVKKICYIATNGKCEPVTVGCRFEACGDVCVDKHERTPSSCNYCTKTRTVALSVQFREKGGQCRCIRVKSVKKEPCGCPVKRWKKASCEAENTLVEYEYSYVPDKSCCKCVIAKTRNILNQITCRGKFTKVGPCDINGKKYIEEYMETAVNCKCEVTLVSTQMQICSCPKPVRQGAVCVENKHEFHTVRFELRDNSCVRRASKRVLNIPCDVNKQVTYDCRAECQRFRVVTFNELNNCKCLPKQKIQRCGLCCCPKNEINVGPCVDMYITIEKIFYDLINNACIRRVEVSKKRCGCEADKQIRYCDEGTGHRVEGFITHKLTRSGECKRQENIKRIPVLCRGVNVEAVTGCTLREVGSAKLYRKIKVSTMLRQACSCMKKVKYHREVCGCQTGEHCYMEKKCAANCADSATCTDDCFSIKVWYKFVFVKLDAGAAQCDKQILKRVTMRCCCPKNPKAAKRCVNNNQIERSRSEVQLLNNKCITKRARNVQQVKCPTGFLGRERGPHRPDGTYVIKFKYGHVKDCKCLTSVRQRTCRYKCAKSQTKTTCDVASGQLVRIVNFEMLNGCRCEARRHTRRVRLTCPEGIQEVDKDCAEETGIETTLFEKTYRKGCKCMVTRFAKTQMCRCPESITTPEVCNAELNQFEWQTISYELMNGKCVKKVLRLTRPVKCDNAVSLRTVCVRSTGEELIYKRFVIARKCECVEKSVIHKRQKCFCERKESQTSMCDTDSNQIVIKRTFQVLNEVSRMCEMKSAEHRRDIQCMEGKSQKRFPCNEVTNRRLIHDIFYQKENCRCKRCIKRTYLPCGCIKDKRVVRTYCDRVLGHFVTEAITRTWNEETDKCVETKEERRNPINCDSNVRFSKTDCDDNFFVETKTWQVRKKDDCVCETKVQKERRPCKCPTRIINEQCPPNGMFKKRTILEFKWDNKLERCVIGNRQVSVQRCRCPSPTKNVECVRGEIHHTTTNEILNGDVCKKVRSLQRVAVVCSAETISNTGACDAKTCLREIKTYQQVLDETKCICVWKILDVKTCKCCGCPPRTVRTECDVTGNRYLTSVTYHTAPKGQMCIQDCLVHHARSYQKVQCMETLPPEHWEECNMNTCKQRKVVYRVKIEACKCVVYKVVTPQCRTCCCPPNPPPTRVCENGDFVTERIVYRLVNYKCRKFASRAITRVPCPVNRDLIPGPCDTTSCLQEVHGTKSLKNLLTCTCHSQRYVHRTQKCCCNKLPHTEKTCDGACIVTRFTYYSFDELNRACVQHTQTSRQCTQCPAQRSAIGTCNRNSCMRINYRYNYQVENCKCKQLVSRTSSRCCCPPETPWTRVCQPDGTILNFKYSYHLVKGECVKQKQQKTFQVRCQEGRALFTTRGACDSFTCKKQVVLHYEQLDNCACKPYERISYETCCCPPPVTRILCENDKDTVRIEHAQELINGQCVPKTRKMLLRTAHNAECNNVQIVEPCVPLRGYRIIRTRVYQIHDCVCRYVRTDIEKQLCECPQPFRRTGPCDPTTCQMTHYFYRYDRSADKHCIRKAAKSFTPCCCLGQPTWEKTECNTITGNMETRYYSKTFNPDTKQCDVKERVSVVETDCSVQEVRIEGDCDHRSMYATDRIDGYSKDFQNCRCVKYSKPTRRLCTCPKERTKRTYCKPDTGEIVTETKRQVFMHEECVPKISTTSELVVCPLNQHTKRVCNGCQGQIITTYNKRVACECKTFRTSKPVLCCCKPPTRTKVCSQRYGNVFEHVTTSYHLTRDSSACKKSRITRTEVVACAKTQKLRVSECDQTTCLKTYTVTQFAVKNCLCVKVGHRSYTKKCCCPPPVVKSVCLQASGIVQHVSIVHRLVNGVCLVDKDVKRTPTVCPASHVRTTECNTRSKQMETFFTSHKRIGCACKKVVQKRSQLCACPPPRICKEKCLPNKPTRFVYKIEYHLINPGEHATCEKLRTNLYEDVCYCPPKQERKFCDNNKIVLVTSFQVLKRNEGGHQICEKQETKRYQTVVCPGKRVVRSSVCARNRREIKTITHDVVNCECKRREAIRLECCDCDTLNHKSEKCVHNQRFIIERYFVCKPGVFKCLDQKKYVAIPIKCPDKIEQKAITPCNIKKDYGFYRRVAKIWYKLDECKCKKMVSYSLKFCKCVPDKWSQFCRDDNVRVIRRLMFGVSDDQCFPREDVVEHEVTCSEPPIKVTKTPCSRNGIINYRIDTSEVKNCRCIRRAKLVKDICCAPPAKQRTYCDVETGHIVTEKTHFRLVQSNVELFRKEDTVIYKSRIMAYKTASRVAIKCPDRQVKVNCEQRSGDMSKQITTHYRVGCECKSKTRVVKTKCRCPAPQVSVGPCIDSFKQITTISFELINGMCIKRVALARQRCACPPPVPSKFCEGNGVTVHCLKTFTLTPTFSCFMEQTCKRSVRRCPSARTLRSGCDASTHKKTTTITSFQLRAGDCECHPVRRSKREYCKCSHLDQSRTYCENGVFITTKRIHRLMYGNCPFETQIQRRLIKCLKPTRIIGPCNKITGMREIKREWHENINCKCVRKESVREVACACPDYLKRTEATTCENNNAKVTRVNFYHFKDGRCLTRTSESVVDVVCSKVKTTCGPCKVNAAGVGYRIITDFKLKAKKCVCTWVLVNSRREICRCPPPTSKTICAQNVRFETITTRYDLNKNENNCVQRITRSVRQLSCDTRESPSVSACMRDAGCLRTHTILYKEAQNCHCIQKQRSFTERCCCPPPTKPHQYCDKDGMTIVKEWSEFKLEDGVCIAVTKKSTRRVRCDRRSPQVEESKCDGTARSITETTFLTKGCACVAHVKVRSKRCGCASKLWKIKGPCVGYFRFDKTMAIRFNVETQKCEEYVVSCVKVRCACPPGSQKTVCEQDHAIVTYRETFTLNEESNSCEKRVTRSVKMLTECSNTVRFVRNVKGECSERTGYMQTDLQEFSVAKACTCRKQVRSKTWPCNCIALRPPTRSSVCENHDRIVETEKYEINVGKKCCKKSRQSVRVIQCIGMKVVRGCCNQQTGNLEIKTLKEVASNCACVWKVDSVKFVPCVCPQSKKIVKCLNNKWVTTNINYQLIDDHCKCTRTSVVNEVQCQEGSKTTRSGCDAFTRKQTFTTFHTKLSECQCLTQRERRHCTCKCPSNQRSVMCDEDTGAHVQRSLVYTLQDCKCIGRRMSKRMPVVCPPEHVTRSGCVLDQNGDGYEVTTITKHVREGCKCKKCVEHSKRLCSCKLLETNHKKCIGDREILTYTIKRMMINGACKTFMCNKRRTFIECGEESRSVTCTRSTGVELTVIKTPSVENCQCKMATRTHSRRCSCDTSKRLVRVIPCNENCRQESIYSYEELVDHQCVKRYYKTCVTCCCPKTKLVSTRCLEDLGIIETTVSSIKLSNGKCVPTKAVTQKRIQCPHTRKSNRIKHDNGILEIQNHYVTRMGCKCQVQVERREVRWKCPPPTKSTKCVDNSLETQVRSVILTTEGQCVRQRKTKRTPILCPPDKQERGLCYRGINGYFYDTTYTTYQKENCECTPSVSKVVRVCRCDQPTCATVCVDEQFVTTTVTYKPSYDEKMCIRSEKVVRKQVNCDSTERKVRETGCSTRSGTFQKIYEHQERVGCACKLVTRAEPCRCRCPEPQVVKSCVGDAQIKIVTIRHELENCQCIAKQSVRYLSIRCKQPTQFRSGCDPVTCMKSITTVRAAPLQCKCQSEQSVREIRCCCPPGSSNTVCDAEQGMFVTTTTSFVLKNNKCCKSAVQSFKKITCARMEQVRRDGECLNGRKQYTRLFNVREGCSCVRKQSIFYRSCVCVKAVNDIVIAIDESTAGRIPDFMLQFKYFLQLLVSQFKIGSEYTQFSIVKFTENPAVVFHLGERNDYASIHDSVDLIPFAGRESNLGKALCLIRKEVMTKARPDASKTVIIISDAYNYKDNLASSESGRLKDEGVQILAITVGVKAEGMEFYKQLVSEPIERNLYAISSFKEECKSLSVTLAKYLCIPGCPEKNVRVGVCSRDTGCQKRVYTTVHVFKRSLAKCQPQTRITTSTCCCLQKDYQFQRCEDNMLKLTRVSYIFNPETRTCIKQIKVSDITDTVTQSCISSSGGRVRTVVSECDADGMKRITTIKKFVENCQCQEKRSVVAQVCRCPSPSVVTVCQDENMLVTTSIDYQLQDGRCWKNQQVNSKQIVCRVPTSSRGSCNQLTCQQRITNVHTVVRNCKCVARRSVLFETCCCQGSSSTRFHQCNENNEKVYITSRKVFDEVTRTCREQFSKKMIPVVCDSQPKTRIGECGIKRGCTLYRIDEMEHYAVFACECKLIRKTKEVACGCAPGRSYTRCESGVIVTYRKSYVLQDDECKAVVNKVSQRVVDCAEHTRRQTRGQCSIPGERAGEYLQEIYTEHHQRTACQCQRRTSVTKVLCACPPVMEKSRCSQRTGAMIHYRIEFTLKPDAISGELSCVRSCTKRSAALMCPPPTIIRTTPCNAAGIRTVCTKVYTTQNCQCVKQTYKKEVSCDLSSCFDVLPLTICRMYSRQPYTECSHAGPIRDELCRSSCGQCSSCGPNEVVFTRKPDECIIHSDARLGNQYVIRVVREASMKQCKQMCREMSKCKSFNFYPLTSASDRGECVLSSTNLRMLSQYFEGRSEEEMVDNQYGSKNCLLMEKQCPLVCPSSTTVHRGACKCSSIRGVAGAKLCYRKSQITHHVPSHQRGKCLTRIWTGLTPCEHRTCDDALSLTECQALKQAGKCIGNREAMAKCKHTCGLCSCTGTYRSAGVCGVNGLRSAVVIKYRRHAEHGKCIMLREELQMQCPYCLEGKKQIVKECKNGVREIIHFETRLNTASNKCEIQQRKQLLSCANCEVQHDYVYVGACVASPPGSRVPATREVITKYFIRDGDCCKLKELKEVYGCKNCPAKVIKVTPCHLGYRLRQVIYHVSYPHDKRCYQKNYTRMERC